jgi:hypothetical protein
MEPTSFMPLGAEAKSQLQFCTRSGCCLEPRDVSDDGFDSDCNAGRNEDCGVWVSSDFVLKYGQKRWMVSTLPIQSREPMSDRTCEERIDDPRDPAWNHQGEEGPASVA